MISIKEYLQQAKYLLYKGDYTDGCSLSQLISKVLPDTFYFCAAHDYGNLGKIEGIRPGLVNQIYFLILHFTKLNPLYWLWGVFATAMTLPWVLWRREIGVKIIRADMFFGLQLIIMFFSAAYFLNKL